MRGILPVFLPLLVAWSVTLGWVVDRWNAPTQYYQHGWLLPFVAAAAVYARRGIWRAVPARTDLRGWWLLGPGLFLHLVGALLMIDSLSATSLILTIPGSLLLALGRERMRGLWPVVGLVLFAVPPPIYLEGRLSFVLKEYAVTGGAGLANLLGADIVRRGADLALEGTTQSLYVADACGGLRSLLAMITVGYCVAFFLGPASIVRRLALLALTVPLAVSANIVRIASLCLMARWFGVPFAESSGHTLANGAEWIADLALLFLADVWLTRRFARAARAPSPPAAVPVASGRGLRHAGIVLWLLAVPLLWLSLYRPSGGGERRAEHLPGVVAGYRLVPRTEAEEARFERALPRWIELLGTDDFVYRHYRRADGRVIHLVALFHDANWKSVHPPRICIEGSDMEIEIDDLITAPWLDGGSTLGRIVARSRRDGWRYLTLSVYGTRDWSSGSYVDFVDYHLPRALLRRSESGFLVRVETPIWPKESLDVAAQRCVDFLGGILPAMRELLR